MIPFEEVMASELTLLVQAHVPARGIRLTVRDLVVARMERGPMSDVETRATAEAAVRAACRLVRDSGAPDELIDLVCGAALEVVRGHGGESARWLGAVTRALDPLLLEAAWEREAASRRRRSRALADR